jgi:prevent-host-death family protein
MKVYSYSQARQQLAAVLDCAEQDGQVKITHRDGRTFVLQPEASTQSPLAVQGVTLSLSALEILQAVQEGRRG